MNINLHIEKLILDGINLSPRERSLLQASVETELTHLLTTDGLTSGLQKGGALPHIAAADVQLTQPANPIQLGQQIARSVYGGMSK